MDTKICNNCKKDLSLENFSPYKRPKRNGEGFYNCISTECKECLNKRRREYAKRRGSYDKDRAKNSRIKHKQWIDEYKSSYKCCKCGESHISCLQFHHLDPMKKEFNISHISKYGKKAEILEEIKKCIVLCANCHFKLHYNERQNNERDTNIL